MRAFTAIGIVKEGGPYQAEMGGGFSSLAACPRDIPAEVEQLEFTSGKRNWGYQLRFGLFEISDVDKAMHDPLRRAPV